MKIGYARVSSENQNLARQIEALKKVWCRENISGKSFRKISSKSP